MPKPRWARWPTSWAVPSRDCGLQFQRLTGGNTELKAEESRAWTVGLVVQPTTTFSVGFDYLDPYGAPFSARGAGGLLWTNQHLIASIQVDAASDPGCADRRTIAAHQFTY